MDSNPGDTLARFGACLVNFSGGWISKGGVVQELEPKEAEVLQVLLAHQGQVVTFLDFKHSVWPEVNIEIKPALSTRISRIRQVLGDASYIQTIRGAGYRFDPDVPVERKIWQPATSDQESVQPLLTSPPVDLVPVPARLPAEQTGGDVLRDSSTRRQKWLAWAAFAGVVLALIIGFGLSALNPVEQPRVTTLTPLTHSGFAKYAPVLNDGENTYFTELAAGHYRIVVVSKFTGVPNVFQTDVPEPYLCSLSRDRKNMLIRSVVGGFDDYGPLFNQPIKGGAAEALPLVGFDGTWTPDGKMLTVARGGEVSLFDLGSRKTRIIARADGYAWWPRWSPNGKHLRFTVSDAQSQMTSIWEVRPDGSGLHRLFAEGEPWSAGGCGNWTADGRYFVFQVGPVAASNLWVADERIGLFGWKHKPTQLTFGPTYRGPQPLEDGRSILARTQLIRGEIRKFSVNGGQTTLLPGVMTDMLTFSPAGDQIAYCLSDQEQTLWISRTDGTGARLLISPPIQCGFPKWSPVGDKIAVSTRKPGEPWRISLVVPSSGEVQQLRLVDGQAIHPTWSPDGRRLLFGSIPSVDENAYLYTVDLTTGSVSTVPGSQGLFTPSWSPNGRYFAALNGGSYQLAVFDTTSHLWTLSSETKFGYPVWSRDSKTMYSVQRDTQGPRLCQFDLTLQSCDALLDLKGYPLLDRWIGLHPDGSVLLARDLSVQEVYLLDWNIGRIGR